MSEKPTPDAVWNRPGLTTLERRIGTRGTFRTSQRRSLSDPHRPGLAPLTTRDPADFSLALLDSWAEIGDILTFYQERISNESYLETAKEALSLREIGRLVGYTPEPATAALVYLAFQIDETLQGMNPFSFEPGIAAQNIPVETDLPETFETIEPLRAHARWNAIRPVRRLEQSLDNDTQQIRISPDATRPRPGEFVAIADAEGNLIQLKASNKAYAARVRHVGDRQDGLAVNVDLVRDVSRNEPARPIDLPKAAENATLPVDNTTALATALSTHRWDRAQVKAAMVTQGLSTHDLRQTLDTMSERQSFSVSELLLFGTRARLFGHNALPDTTVSDPSDPNETLTVSRPQPGTIANVLQTLQSESDKLQDRKFLYLDRSYDDVFVGDHLVLRATKINGTKIEAALKILDVSNISVAAFGQSGEVTRIQVAEASANNWGQLQARSAEVLTGTQTVPLAATPVAKDVTASSTLMCEGALLDLALGQTLILSGERADLPGVEASEIVKIADMHLNGPYTELTFTAPLSHPYRRETVVLNGNVALASHGETRVQVLGSGNGLKAGQSFALPDGPLTYLPSENATGRSPSLTLHVDTTEWSLVDHFRDSSPNDRVFTLDRDIEGNVRLVFGDGIRGRRLPTGVDNVVATYRVGAGLSGSVAKDRITLLLRKPLGISSVTNPLPSFGGSAGEDPETLRRNIPISGMTLGRVVSLQDYADFARGFSGIAKSHASWGWQGESRQVWLTVAGDGGHVLPAEDGPLPRLIAKLGQIAPPGMSVHVRNHVPILAEARLQVFIETGFDTDVVLFTVRERILEGFGFRARDIGTPLRASRLMAMAQGVPGVLAVDIDQLHRQDQPHGNHAILRARLSQRGSRDQFLGSEIITIDRETLDVRAVA